MDETGRLGALAFAYTALLCGAFTKLFGEPLALIATGVAIGALVGGGYALVCGPRPSSPSAGKPALDIEMAVGSLVGALIGAAVAGIDALLGASVDAGLPVGGS